METVSIESPSPSINLKAATDAAFEFLMTMKETMGSDFSNIRLEEVERSPDGSRWIITLGYNLRISKEEARASFGSKLGISSIMADAISDTVKREYKIFEVNAETGEVESMKIRTV